MQNQNNAKLCQDTPGKFESSLSTKNALSFSLTSASSDLLRSLSKDDSSFTSLYHTPHIPCYLFIYLNDYPLIFMVLHKSVLDNVTTELS